MRVSLLLVFVFALSSGCTSFTPVTPEEAAIQQDAARPVICRDGEDCRQKWARAVSWVSQVSTWKIQSQTDFLIETDGPGLASPRSAFTVNRKPFGNGQYKISIKSA